MKNEQTAEAVLYAWACGAMTTAQAKATCLKLGYQIDFRQADNNNLIEAFNLNTQTWETLEV
jgi:hypothetical protein|tara:strand:+ start:570 stop:755 length:186 start_codon:yes stop_codon:yes gene_type:complete